MDGYLYRTSKWFEKLFLLNADVVISLTNAAVEEMKKFSYLKEKKINYIVITTCTDLSVFKPSTTLNIVNPKEKPFIVGYVGSVGVWYMFRESLEFYKLIKEIIPDAQLHILNKGGHDYIEKSLVKEGVNRSNVLLETKDREGVVSAMQLMDVGLFMIKPLYSKIASMPTKLGEFLACGIPCVGNSGVGDMADIIVNERVGVILNSFEKDEKIKCVSDLLELINDADHKKRCVKTAFQYFSLKNGVESYKKIYQSLNDK